MPIKMDNHDPQNPVDVRPGTNEATALCFLYQNAEYGFKPAEVRENTDIPKNSTYKALTRLYEKDIIGKTADGYYHALDDAHVAQFVESLAEGEKFTLNTGKEPYPNAVEENSVGFPDDDQELKIGDENADTDEWKEEYPNT